MLSTTLLYLSDPDLFETRAIVIGIEPNDPMTVVVDQTPAYPQGGGQPSDHGLIAGVGIDGPMFRFTSVSRGKDQVIRHAGRIERGSLSSGDSVTIRIDAHRRRINSQLHTAGEIICAAVHSMGYDWPVVAASHFPGQARVAFKSPISSAELSAFRTNLVECIELIVRSDFTLDIESVGNMEELRRFCPHEPVGHFNHWPLRLVSPIPGFWRPCLGAHCKRTAEVGRVALTKVRLRDGELSVGYEIDKLPSPHREA